MDYKKYMRVAAEILKSGVDGVLPPRCALTGDIVDRIGALSPVAWRSLTFVSKPFCQCCGYPFDVSSPVQDDVLQCGACLDRPKPYHQARSVFVYNDESKKLVLGFKHGDQTHLKVTFAPLLYRVGKEILEQADLIVPVPLHRWRLLSRRYNQAALLAASLSGASAVPWSAHVLRRVRHTAPQGHKSNKDRHENVRHAFEVRDQDKEKISGKSIVLIDDVYTTGATLEECVRMLLAAGAGKVDVLTLARVVKSN